MRYSGTCTASRREASRSVVSPHLTSPHLTSPHLTSPHVASRRLTSPHVIPRCLLLHSGPPPYPLLSINHTTQSLSRTWRRSRSTRASRAWWLLTRSAWVTWTRSTRPCSRSRKRDSGPSRSSRKHVPRVRDVARGRRAAADGDGWMENERTNFQRAWG